MICAAVGADWLHLGLCVKRMHSGPKEGKKFTSYIFVCQFSQCSVCIVCLGLHVDRAPNLLFHWAQAYIKLDLMMKANSENFPR